MAQITRRPFRSHLRATATSHVVQLKKGKVKRSGAGLSFWFRPLTASLSEVPIDNRDMSLFFHTRTSDFQDAGVQATVSYRIADPNRASERVDFSISPASGKWMADPLAALGQLVSETGQQHATATLATMTLTEALSAGIGATREAITAGLDADERLRDTGVAIVGVRVLAIKPEAEMERALQTPTRESVQQAADRATYERRALAVESERAISENELQSKIELATREKDLLAQEGANARTRAGDAAAAQGIADDATARGERVLGEARAQAAKALVEAYNGADASVLLARAAATAAENIGSVGSITITPDMLSNFLGGARGGRA